MTDLDLTFYDASRPPASPPAADGVGGYIGGDTPYTWTRADWASQPARYRLPIWTRTNTRAVVPAGDVQAAVRQLGVIGAPAGSLIAVDMETTVDPAYLAHFSAGMGAAGFTVMPYGSLPGLFANQAPSGLYWGASPTGTRHMAAGCIMTQYEEDAAGGAWDVDLFDGAHVSLLWDTRGSGAPASPSPTWLEDIMRSLPTVRNGSADTTDGFWAVHRVQGLCNALRPATLITIDGLFGPATEAAVKAVQEAKGITVDGIVGPQTWAELVAAEKTP